MICVSECGEKCDGLQVYSNDVRQRAICHPNSKSLYEDGYKSFPSGHVSCTPFSPVTLRISKLMLKLRSCMLELRMFKYVVIQMWQVCIIGSDLCRLTLVSWICQGPLLALVTCLCTWRGS
jgi:hypothetical protein